MSYARTLRKTMLPHLQPDRVSLDQVNDLITEGFYHPTKGYCKITLRRSRAAMITAEVKRGMRPWANDLMKAET